jgi:hypothetical protein
MFGVGWTRQVFKRYTTLLYYLYYIANLGYTCTEYKLK